MTKKRIHITSERARDLILRFGWNSTCYQLLNVGIEHWFSADKDAFVGFVRSGRVAIVGGAPVCKQEDLSSVVAEWEEFAAQQRLEICYFGAEARLQAFIGPLPGYASVVLGSQPEWSPNQFLTTFTRSPSLRAQLNRARNKGVIVSEWSRKQAEGNENLANILREWLAAKGLPTLHFLVEPETLGDLRDRRIFVAERESKPIGFVTLCPIPAQNGWLTEQFVRCRSAPNGTVELMLSHSVDSVARDGAGFVTMGIVPLVSLAGQFAMADPVWLSLARAWAKAHYTRFYNFRGLAEFKSKFQPDRWTPVVVIMKDKQFRLTHLRAIARAFTQISPEFALLRGAGRALKEESVRFLAKVKGN